MEQAVIFVFGAINYMAIEILWRGYTHWSMAIAGGVCTAVIYSLNARLRGRGILYKALLGAVVITIIELVTGIIINRLFGWDVWDYSEFAFNVLGQICPAYFLLWFLLCIPVIRLFDYFKYGK